MKRNRANLTKIITAVLLLTLLAGMVPAGAFQKNVAVNVAANATLDTLKAKSFAAVYVDSGEIVFSSENAREHFSVGNMVKLMTLYLTMEAVSQGKTGLQSGVTVSKAAQSASVGRERVYLDAGKGEVITVEEAVTAVCVGSAVDAAYALAEHVSGSDEAAFVAMMNAKAAELGMTDTVFLDSTGVKILEEGQYSCAADMAILGCAAVRDYPELLKYTVISDGMFVHKSTGQPDTQMISSNALVNTGMCEGADGLLVGYSKADLYAQVASCSVNGERAVAVVIGEATPEDRAGELKFLLEHTVASFETKTLDKAGTYVRMISIKDGKALKAKTCTASDFSYIANLTETYTVEKRIEIDGIITAPVQVGEIIGRVIYEKCFTDAEGNKTFVEIGSVDLLIDEDVDRAGWFTRFIRKILKFFGLGDYL